MKKKLVFPNLFWWGAASSGPQTEGQYGKVHENVMDYGSKRIQKIFSIMSDLL
ncbi:glycosyl hydrolase family protein [Streptococcus pneumoniae]|nr:glycosyl hydrolase family protein [Streptococcus pneumoniae]